MESKNKQTKCSIDTNDYEFLERRYLSTTEITRWYMKQFIEYFNQFYITSKANRGNYQLSEGDGKQEQTDKMFD